MSAHVWLGDGLVPMAQARVSVADRGFTSGVGVFEAMKVIKGKPFAITRHLARLDSSMAAIGLARPASLDLREAVTATIAANSARSGDIARLRITVTAGIGEPGPHRNGADVTVVITSDPLPPHPLSARVITVAWPRNERALLVAAKTTSYAENLAILDHARTTGAHEALIQDTQGRLCEGTTSNVVVAFEGRLITPSLATGCLGGVTRALILEWGLAQERDIQMDQLSAVSEVLLSSSTRDLLPVSWLDGRPLATPGPLGAAAASAFVAQAAANPDP